MRHTEVDDRARAVLVSLATKVRGRNGLKEGGQVQDQATLQAIEFVNRAEDARFTITDHRRLRELARQASEESRRDYWPGIWGYFAEHFDAR